MPEREHTLQTVLPEVHPPHHHAKNLWVGILLLLISLGIQLADSSAHGLVTFSCRLVLALGVALIGSYLGEFLKIKLKIPHLEAYGAAALFLIVLLGKWPTPDPVVEHKRQPNTNVCWHMFSPEIFEPAFLLLHP